VNGTLSLKEEEFQSPCEEPKKAEEPKVETKSPQVEHKEAETLQE
jgi:hypothetical protein